MESKDTPTKEQEQSKLINSDKLQNLKSDYFIQKFFDYMRDLIEVAIKYDIIKKSGAWFDIVDVETGEILQGKIHGQANVYELLETNEELLNKVQELVDKFMKEN